MLPEPYNNNYRIEQSPGYVTIMVEMNHDIRIIPVDGRAPLSPKIAQWVGDSRGHWEGDTLVVETRNLKFNHQSRFGVGYLNGASDENLRVVERFTRTDANTRHLSGHGRGPDGLHQAVDGGNADGQGRGRHLRGGVPRGQLRHVQHPVGPPRRGTRRGQALGP